MVTTIDWDRPYGKVCGVMEGGGRFQQDGKFFTGTGELVGEEPEVEVVETPEPLETPEPVTIEVPDETPQPAPQAPDTGDVPDFVPEGLQPDADAPDADAADETDVPDAVETDAPDEAPTEEFKKVVTAEDAEFESVVLSMVRDGQSHSDVAAAFGVSRQKITSIVSKAS